MKERPVLFSAPMVRAILAGTKTQTRRPLRDGTWWDSLHGVIRQASAGLACTGFAKVACPYGQPGDRLWVREAHGYVAADKLGPVWDSIIYRADGNEGWSGKWRPSIHMPRAASRITLEVTEVRVERLQDISEADARAEGITDQQSIVLRADGSEIRGPVAEYAVLWEQINGPYAWEANPWVWAVSFRKLPQ